MKLNTIKNYKVWYKNIKWLRCYKWYRYITGGNWYCNISKLSWEGYDRNWVRSKPEKNQFSVHIEIYRKDYNYNWVIPYNQAISLKQSYFEDYTGEKREIFYCFHKTLLSVKTRFSTKPMKVW